jgi:subtilase family serine protease
MPKTKKIVKKSMVKKPISKSLPAKKMPQKKKPVSRQSKAKKTNNKLTQLLVLLIVVMIILGVVLYLGRKTDDNKTINTFRATPYNVVKPLAIPSSSPNSLLSPVTIKKSYNLGTGTNTGSGTIAIIDAFDDPTAEADLATFSNQFSLPACTTANSCFTKHKMSSSLVSSSAWAIEDSLDLQWAHAVAPTAKILLIESKSDNGVDLVDALNYVKTLPNIVSVSMSWGGGEFNTETAYENSFVSNFGATYFAASGDSGHGTSWPAVSANVVGVGGTTINVNSSGVVTSEVAWSGSGGGISRYVKEPIRQINAKIPYANGYRATPDVSYNADPNTGYPVYDSFGYNGYKGWFQVGGTSAGTPQWAAIATLSNKTLTIPSIYADANSNAKASFFRDITSGKNGSCGVLCTSITGYDYVTGYGSPLAKSY